MNRSTNSPSDAIVPQQLLTGDNCVSSTRIRAFLALSRIATDDTIRPHLNEIKRAQCDNYFNTKIVPQWKARQQAILFCRQYAEGLRKDVADGTRITSGDKSTIPETPEFDLRTDPYALKAYHQNMQEKFVQIEVIDNWIKNEEAVEAIITSQTVDVLNEKCEYKDWMSEFNATVKSTNHA